MVFDPFLSLYSKQSAVCFNELWRITVPKDGSIIKMT